MRSELEKTIQQACKELFGLELKIDLTRPDEQFGDYATNVALQLAGRLQQPPNKIAEALVAELRGHTSVKEAVVAGPGFINLWLADGALLKQALAAPKCKSDAYKDQTVVLEYSDPNPFKVLHAGHLYTSIVGDAISNLMDRAGAKTHRVNFGGDVGLHAGKTMWSIVQELDGEHPDKLAEIPEADRSEWMARCYIQGTRAYEEDKKAKDQIIAINKHIYELHDKNDHDSPFARIYWTCRQWSYDYFDAFYERIGSHFDKYYPESETAPLGVKTIREQLEKGVYETSDGAVVFKAEPYGLHTRVFINSNGLPTYEAKDVGLILKKQKDYRFDTSVVITGNDIAEYMKVVLKSVEQFAPELAKRTVHLTHGNVKLAGGVKMSSRKGNFLRASDVIDMVAEMSNQANGANDEHIVLGAIKYAFIRHRIGADIVFDPGDSVSLQGNSGPYLQYAHARARSILAKVPVSEADTQTYDLEKDERSIVRKISQYPEVIDQAISDLMPHHICIYLYELAQTFNRFYEHNRVIDDRRESLRLRLVEAYADTLKDGLKLLGIHAPDKM